MLNVPFLSDFIQKHITKQAVADSVDYLNYYVTALLLAFFAFATSAKQYFGSPIQCWVPSEFKGGWEKYAEDYCFIANSYYIPFDSDIPKDHKLRQDQISYYRWVPIVLALQSAMFFLPNFFWNKFHKQCAINPDAFLREGEKVNALSGDTRDKELQSLAEFFMDTVSTFGRAGTKNRVGIRLRSGYNAMFLYLFTKTLYVANLVGQIILLNHFLGEDFLQWGYRTSLDIIHGNEWQETPVFPRVIMCDFKIRVIGSVQNWSVQCVIMLNLINEKLYLFLYYWLLILMTVTLANFMYYIVMFTIPQLRASLVLFNITEAGESRKRQQKDGLNRCVRECLHPDGVLLLQFLREHVGGRLTFELTNKIVGMYVNNGTNSDNDSDSTPRKLSYTPPNGKRYRPLTYQSYGPPPTSKVTCLTRLLKYLDEDILAFKIQTMSSLALEENFVL
ncbi:hypothetical protein WR25_23119 isoform C [Diploscapter pachys]|uniref:Innexin n=1 Tax=Diploscapter pachys TaxID=2018661 RepID=A0A2A2LQJ2_9BILA|nr:hypothetical protein WR25_23119 isoform C [Diploscapter pachys]